jgi:hypothetical protein
MNDSKSDDWEKKLTLIGALAGPFVLYLAAILLRHDSNAFGLVDYFWSIPAGAITGYLMPSAWPSQKD